jgi:hypothetical protein
MGWSNNLVALYCALDFAIQKNLRVALADKRFLTSSYYPDLAENLNKFFSPELQRNIVDLHADHECVHTLSWSDAFYRMKVGDGTRWDGCTILPLSPALLDLARNELETAARTHSPSVHLRNLDGQCESRYKLRAFMCARELGASPITNPCTYSPVSLAESFGVSGAIAYSDGQQGLLDGYAGVDRHDFFTQYALMALSPRHVGNPMSSVDLLVSAWRKQIHGPGTTLPAGCYA